MLVEFYIKIYWVDMDMDVMTVIELPGDGRGEIGVSNIGISVQKSVNYRNIGKKIWCPIKGSSFNRNPLTATKNRNIGEKVHEYGKIGRKMKNIGIKKEKMQMSEYRIPISPPIVKKNKLKNYLFLSLFIIISSATIIMKVK